MRLTFGQRVSDIVAKFGGSWTFIICMAILFISWILLNSFILSRIGGVFDPYPYILLNLFLLMMATIQAPIILMSQNRQEQKDRVKVEHAYKINIKTELEIISLHVKMDLLREQDLKSLLDLQQKTLKLLEEVIERNQLK